MEKGAEVKPTNIKPEKLKEMGSILTSMHSQLKNMKRVRSLQQDKMALAYTLELNRHIKDLLEDIQKEI